MKMENETLQVKFLIGSGVRVNITLPSNASTDRLIVENLFSLHEARLNIVGVSMGTSGAFISRAALETIVTLSEEQAAGWITVVRSAANASGSRAHQMRNKKRMFSYRVAHLVSTRPRQSCGTDPMFGRAGS